MTTDIYSALPPLPGVPETSRLNLAAAANGSLSKAVAAGIRAARAVGDVAVEANAIHPGASALSKLGKKIENNVSNARSGNTTMVFGGLLSTIVFGGFSALVAVDAKTGSFLTPRLPACTAFFVSTFLAIWTAIWLANRPISNAIRRDGFHGEEIPNAVVRKAGQCLVVGAKALQVVTTLGDLVPSAKTVFYDAIGIVRLDVGKDGTETLVINDRAGDNLARIDWPEAAGYPTPYEIVDMLNAKATASRMTA